MVEIPPPKQATQSWFQISVSQKTYRWYCFGWK